MSVRVLTLCVASLDMYCSKLIFVLYLMAMLEVSGFSSIAGLDIHVLLCYYVYHGIMDRSYYYGLMYFVM